MDTVSFLRRVLPATGLYIIARHVEGKWRHQVCDSIEEAAAYALQFDSQGVPTYHACAAYRERSVERKNKDGEPYKVVRVQENVRALRSFWLDLDCGEGKAYPDQEAAVDALLGFCNATGLPTPLACSSGYGIHCYWTLTDEISPDQWKQTAEGLKALCAQLKFNADPACTGDSARVLRSVGTWNRKDSSNPRPVELIADAADVPVREFAERVSAALHSLGIKPPDTYKPRETEGERLNEAFAIQREFPPCSAHKVADRCQQFRQFRDKRGCMPEPFWYAALQLSVNTIEGDALAHEWSSGYPGYSQAQTDTKLAQVRDMGPTLCSTFESRNPGGCAGCTFLNKISSPAQLGTKIESAPAPVVEAVVANEPPVQITLSNPPFPFTRGVDGGIFIEEEGVTHQIYEYDCFPTEISWDEQLGYETVRLRHWLPQDGWKECRVRSSLLARPTDFESALRDNHIQPLIRNRMVTYLDSYIRDLRAKTKLKQLFKSLGWKSDDTEFVLGDRLYRKEGVVQAGHSASSRGFLEGFHAKGDLAAWRELTWVLGQPGFEPHAFLLLSGLAPPLLKLAGRQGFTVSALGDTGTGKSTMGKFIASIYGHPDATWVPRDSTINALYERIGAYYSVPVYMDEITTIDPKDLRNLVYRIATGKARDRLKQDASVREGAQWSTILVVSTNDSLQSKLQLEKSNPEAEAMRLFEVEVPRTDAFEAVAGLINDTLAENYGLAGGEYIRRIVENREQVRAELRPWLEQVAAEFQMAGKERFWTQAIALSLYGGMKAREWGLIDFDPNVIRPWLQQETKRMRGDIQNAVLSPVEILGEYLNEYIGERIVVKKEGMLTTVHKPPVKSLSQRLEMDTHLLFVSRTHLKRWADERRLNFSQMKTELHKKGILMSPDARKILGAGTQWTGVEQTPCWKIDARHPELGLAA